MSALSRVPTSGPTEASPSVSTTDLSALPPWEPPASVARGARDSFEERVRLSLRIVVALARLGPQGDNGAARREATQQGLAESLGVTQGAVSKVLNQLAAADMVRGESRHVAGVGRRVRVYYLSSEGEMLAREISERFGIPSDRPVRT